MKIATHVFIHFFLLFNSVNSWAELSENANDPYLVKQKEECAKRPNKYWDEARARCVERAENKAQRAADTEAGNACLKLTDLEQRKACFMEQAREKTGNLNSSPEKSGAKTAESIITHAYTIMSIIQMFGQGESNCTSRTIFGVTSMAGSLSDIYLRIQSKKKMKSLQEKFEMDLKTNRYDAQVKALEYLKEEQKTIADIASNEAKRNMIMMAGYGVALGVAAYEIVTNPACVEKPVAAETPPPAETAGQATGTEGGQTTGADANANASANSNADAQQAAPAAQAQPAAPAAQAQPAAPAAQTVAPAAQPGPVTNPAHPTANISVGTNTKGTTFMNGTVDGQKIDIMGSKVYSASGTPIGTYNRSTGLMTIGGKTFNVQTSPVTGSLARTWQGQRASLNSYGASLIRKGP